MCSSQLFRQTGKRLSVYVASSNPVKINSVKAALRDACPNMDFELQGVYAHSSVVPIQI
jgi:non-canonical (house-cleaning) NTP pyrophosphatase